MRTTTTLINVDVLNLGSIPWKKLINLFFFKELKKVWTNIKKRGPFSASNTLLIDDQPYKAFLNPPNSAIFPQSYKPDNDADTALDPKGELSMYLKRVAEAHDVTSYVKDHPFGQPAVTSSHPDWKFYTRL